MLPHDLTENIGIEQLQQRYIYSVAASPMDPNREQTEVYLRDHALDLQKMLKSKIIPPLGQKSVHLEFLLNDQFTIEGYVFPGNDIEFSMTVYNTNWLREQKDRENFVFAKNDGENSPIFPHLYTYPVDIIADRLGISRGLEDFDYKNNPRKMRNAAPWFDMDKNIVELMFYLNVLGIHTSYSCAGHAHSGIFARGSESPLPMIYFRWDSLEEVVKLAKTLKMVSGHSWRLASSSHTVISSGESPSAHLKTILLIPANPSLQQAQQDLNVLTDFLAKKLNIPQRDFPLAVVTGNWKRRLSDFLTATIK